MPLAPLDHLSSVSPRRLDRAEQILAASFYALFVARLWPEEMTWAQFYVLLILVSEGFVLLFLLIRRPTENVSIRPIDWLVAVGATCGALAVAPSDAVVWAYGGGTLLLVGTVLQFAAKLSLNRSFGLVAANRGIKSDGLYRFVRHPIYTGYALTHLGYLLSAFSLWNVAVYVGVWTCMAVRINAEERVLSEDPAYRAFQRKTRYRLLPGVY